MLNTMKIGLPTGLCSAVGSGWLLTAALATEAEPRPTGAPLVMLPTSPLAFPDASDKALSSDLDNLLLLLLIVLLLGLVVLLSLKLLRRQSDVFDYRVRDMPADRSAGNAADDPRILGQGSNAPLSDQPRRPRGSPAARHEILQPRQGPSQSEPLMLSVARQVARGGKDSAGTAGEIRLFAECGRHAQEIADAVRQDAVLAACAGHLPEPRDVHSTPSAEPPAGMLATASDPHDERSSGRQNHRYLMFTLGGERLAVSSRCVGEILLASPLSFEQDLPPCIRALIELRGARVPVIDLGQNAGGQQTRIDWNTRILLLEVSHDGRRHPLGVLVDAVQEIVTIAQLDNAPPAAMPVPIRSDFIQGRGQVEGRLVTLLDIGKGLSPDERAAIAALTRLAPDVFRNDMNKSSEMNINGT